MHCTKRLTYKDLLVRFGDGKHRFYLETVCGNSVLEEGLCNYCKSLVVQTKTQDSGTFPHGLVTGPYTKESHIYDSPWYHSKVRTYGPPTVSDLELAKKAQMIAKTGKKIRTIPALQADVGSSGVAALPTPESSSPVVPVNILQNTVPVKEVDVAKKEKKRGTPRKKKDVVLPSTIVETSVLTQLGAVHETVLNTVPSEGMIESMDMPLEVKTVIKVVLRPFSHGTGTYWRDSSLEKLYKRKSDGSLGEYIGRWDSSSETIVKDAPDSDADIE
jgi:hypothetical protein